MSNRLRARTANAVRHGLHYASAKHPLAEVVPDANWSGMWRVRWPDGQLSDMANLTRAKDAAFVIAQKGSPARDGRLLRWQTAPLGQPHRRPVVRPNKHRPTGHPMLDSLNLAARQRAMIDNAADDVPIGRVEKFTEADA
jgi:hypothetical protein